MEETRKHHNLIIQNEISELNRLVSFLERLEEEWSLPPALVPSLNLALEEALSNVIFYAFESGTENQINIEFSLKEKEITIVISDEGKPYDPTQKEDPDLSLPVEDRPIGGLGIFLIRQIMDDVKYCREDRKNRLTLIKKWN